MLAMQYAAKIYGCYALTLATVVGYATYTIRRGRQLGRELTPEDRPWT